MNAGMSLQNTTDEGSVTIAEKFSDTAFSYAGNIENFTADNTPVNPPASPEPSSLALLGTSVLCIAGLGRRLFF